MIVRLYLLSHVVVLVLQVKKCSSFSIFLIDEIDAFADCFLLLLEEFHVMVADDVREVGCLDFSLETYQMEESFIS